MKIYIATPMYACQCNMNYMVSVQQLVGKGVNYSLHTIGNESLITRGRNNFITDFYVNFKDDDYLLFWDSDIAIEPESILKLINHNKDVIGAPVRLKNKQNRLFSLTPKLDKDGNFIKEGSLVEVHYFATGIMLLSRKAVYDLIEDAKRNDDIYTNKSNPMKIENSNFIYDVFKIGINDKTLAYDKRVYLSEDYWVCNTLQRLGYKLYIDESINTKHYGTMDFECNDGLYVETLYKNEGGEKCEEKKCDPI
ncbi:MAG: hypothetical protein ACYDEI_00095 [Erysipelotrichaceae bacterium]